MRARLPSSAAGMLSVSSTRLRCAWTLWAVSENPSGIQDGRLGLRCPARRRSEGGRAGGWGLRLVTMTSCGAADRPIGSASACAATPGSLAGLPLSDGVGWVKVTVCRRRYFVRRRRHARQQDSSRVSPRPACDAGCSMLHARVVFGRGWACVWRGAGGRGDDGGAGWYALRNAKEASTDVHLQAKFLIKSWVDLFRPSQNASRLLGLLVQ